MSIEKIGSYNEGSLAFCCTSIQGKKIEFISLYATTMFKTEFFTSQLEKLSDYQLYVSLDMDAFVNNNLDKSCSALWSSQESASQAFNHFITDI